MPDSAQIKHARRALPTPLPESSAKQPVAGVRMPAAGVRMPAAGLLRWATVVSVLLLAVLLFWTGAARAQAGAFEDTLPDTSAPETTAPDTTAPAADLVAREAQLLYLVNLERQKAGIPPLRWNRELSEASRWFAQDAVDGDPISCDHTDSRGEGPGTRMRRFGYANPAAFGEILVCGFVEPNVAVWAWTTSEEDNYAQKAMLLDPRFREAGTAYYLNPEKRRGLVTLNLAGDLDFAPVIINHEAPTTASATVSLYIYPTRLAPIAIKVSSNPTFAGATWQPYVSEMDVVLPPGTGWRTVYVLTRDSSGAISLASDSIWLGESVPATEISLDQASSIGVGLKMEALPAGEDDKVRFSLGWEYDDADGKYAVYRGAAEAVADDTAVAGAALRMRGGDRETRLRTTFPTLPRNRILTLYVRLKTDAVAASDPLVQLALSAGGQDFVPRAISASAFQAANRWQEFAVDFLLPADSSTSDLEIDLAHTGAQTVWLDTVRVYSQPVPANEQIIWPMDQSGIRSQAVQARLQTPEGLGEPFDLAYTSVDTLAPHDDSSIALQANPGALVFEAVAGEVSAQGQVVLVCGSWCASVAWQAQTNAPWLRFLQAQEGLMVYVDPAGLTKGAYQSLITLSPAAAHPSSSDAADATANAPAAASVQQTWIDVRVNVDGATDLPPLQINSIVWLPITTK